MSINIINFELKNLKIYTRFVFVNLVLNENNSIELVMLCSQ